MSAESIPAPERELEWRVIERAPDYKISRAGVIVRVAPKPSRFFNRALTTRFRRPNEPPQAHLRIGVRDYIYVALPVLVAEAFLGNPPRHWAIVLQKDGDAHNCSADNLQWSTGCAWSFEQLEAMAWREIAGCPGFAVSEYGVVRRPNQRIAVQSPDPDGYFMVAVRSSDGVQHWRRVAALVCEAFHGVKSSPDLLAAHNDGTRTNDHYTNLRWATPMENSHDRFKHGTMTSGETHPTAVLKEDQVIQIYTALLANLHDRSITKHLAQTNSVTRDLIYQIKFRRCWKELLDERFPNQVIRSSRR